MSDADCTPGREPHSIAASIIYICVSHKIYVQTRDVKLDYFP